MKGGTGLILLLGGAAVAVYFLTRQTITVGTTANPISVPGQSAIPVSDMPVYGAPAGPPSSAGGAIPTVDDVTYVT